MKGGTGLPPRICIFGRPAVGKTSVAAYADDPFFILSPGETGLHTLIDSGQLPANIPNIEVPDWPSYMGILDDLVTAQHQRKTLVVDVINGMEKLANFQVARTDYGGDMSGKGFMNYQAGYRTCAMGIWKEMLVALDRLRKTRKMMVVLLAHTGVGTHKNPQGDDYSRWVPAFDGKGAWESCFAWCDAVLFADYEVYTTKEKSDSKAKGKGGDRRILRTEWNAAYDAKNRYGMPAEIEMGSSGQEAWANIKAALASSNSAKKE